MKYEEEQNIGRGGKERIRDPLTDIVPEDRKTTGSKEKSSKNSQELELPELPRLLERWYRGARPQDILNLLSMVRYHPGIRKDSRVLVSVNGTGKLISAEEILDFLESIVPSTKP